MTQGEEEQRECRKALKHENLYRGRRMPKIKMRCSTLSLCKRISRRKRLKLDFHLELICLGLRHGQVLKSLKI